MAADNATTQMDCCESNDRHSNMPVQINDKDTEENSAPPMIEMANPKNVYRLKNSQMSKSMPLCLKPGVTAEDDDISSLRTYRYLKLDASSEKDLPCPRKFVHRLKPEQLRLTRSQSAHACMALTKSIPNSTQD